MYCVYLSHSNSVSNKARIQNEAWNTHTDKQTDRQTHSNFHSHSQLMLMLSPHNSNFVSFFVFLYHNHFLFSPSSAGVFTRMGRHTLLITYCALPLFYSRFVKFEIFKSFVCEIRCHFVFIKMKLNQLWRRHINAIILIINTIWMCM